jgi:ATP-binding cassette subfamily F protein 3
LSFLAKFQFRADDVDKMVTVLSGGERARLSMATLIRDGVNLLLLDEPTNHMDIQSMEAMEDAILSFTGAVILVTHDRYLLGRVADSLLRIHDNKVEFRDGCYEDNKGWVDLDISCESISLSDNSTSNKSACMRQTLVRPNLLDRDKEKIIRRWERKVQEAESNVENLEKQIAAIDIELTTVKHDDWQTFSSHVDFKKALEMELVNALNAWEEVQTALEEAST